MPRRTLLDRFTRGLLRVSIATGNVSAQTATSDDAPHPQGTYDPGSSTTANATSEASCFAVISAFNLDGSVAAYTFQDCTGVLSLGIDIYLYTCTYGGTTRCGLPLGVHPQILIGQKNADVSELKQLL